MSATKSSLRSLALISATLLALVLIFFSFSQTASAKQNSPDDDEARGVVGGFSSEPLPADGDVSKVRGVMEVPEPPKSSDNERGDDAGKRDQDPPDSGPRDKRMRLTIPELGMKDLLLRNSSEQSFLDREGIMHLRGTDFPWQENSNTYIAGHAIGYPGGRVPEAFRNLSSLRKGDRVTLRDARGETYRYRVYERLIVGPMDYWVTQPVRGKDIVSLQTCYPEPSFEKRLIVRAERV